jgi:tetratricopeptide (TPR) repeat protein
MTMMPPRRRRYGSDETGPRRRGRTSASHDRNDRAGLKGPFAFAYASMARALAHLADGELHQALERGRLALEIAERSRGPLEQGAAHRVLGEIHEALGSREESEGAYRRSLEILEGIQSLPDLGQTLLAYGRFQLADDPDAGRTLIERARALFAQIDATGWVREADLTLAPREPRS